MHRHQQSLLLCVALTAAVEAMFYYPSPAYSQLEHILVDNWGAYASNFTTAITPCTNYVSQTGLVGLNSGRTTAAQWIRVAFHDFVTANVTAETGGMDASIGFETLREENSGSAFNDSFSFWAPFANAYVPMADLVALGTVMSMNVCGGRYVPYRPGRVDATSAGATTGVPAPNSSLADTLSFFDRAGFNMADSIGLTACGHTFGSVHHGGFPTVTPDSYVTRNNTNGGARFDTTFATFDSRVVHEYIDGTGNQGGILVTSFNESSRSDLRLYESDSNQTMQELYGLSDDGFRDKCINLTARMLNTVPSGVNLGDVVQALPIKPINVTWDLAEDGSVFLSGKIRILSDGSGGTSQTLSLAFSNGYSVAIEPEAEDGSSVFDSQGGTNITVYGITQYYAFSIPADDVTGAVSFSASPSPQTRRRRDSIPTWSFVGPETPFIVPRQTSAAAGTLNITIASTAGLDPSQYLVSVAVPVPQQGTIAPRIAEGPATMASAVVVNDGVQSWSGAYELPGVVTGNVVIKLLTGPNLDVIVDTLLVNTGPAGW